MIRRSAIACFVSPYISCNVSYSTKGSFVCRSRPFKFSKCRKTADLPVLKANFDDGLVLSEENVNIALEEVKEKLGSIFGNNRENLEVGITGDVELSSIEGPIVVLRLKGRFWHKRTDVLARVASYLTSRIPEICDVEIEDVQQLQDSEEESARLA